MCDEWHYFEKFCKWYEDSYYNVNNEIMCIDKDILIKGNKIYSPQTCIIVPYTINMLFVKNKGKRGELPIGVTYNKEKQSYDASCSKNGCRFFIGRYTTFYEAFLAYKKTKERHIKFIADQYKDKIPQCLYDAMYKYQVEITD